LPVPVSPVMRTEMSVVATFWSLRKMQHVSVCCPQTNLFREG
jgi:hypothetical protein